MMVVINDDNDKIQDLSQLVMRTIMIMMIVALMIMMIHTKEKRNHVIINIKDYDYLGPNEE